MTISIIGIDCATQANNVGLARGYISNDRIVIDKLQKLANTQSVAELVSNWIETDANSKHLLAIDAPLGWPVSLGQELFNHAAGGTLNSEANILFRRQTDQFIKAKTGQLPLDVGADRIARTAHAALQLLSKVRVLKGVDIPLAWNPQLKKGISAIEVYPAATLRVSAMRYRGYKQKENTAQRKEICAALSTALTFKPGVDISLMEKDDDVLDAAVCVLAGFHFIQNKCMFPMDKSLAKKEGWIWVKNSEDNN